MEEKIIQFNSKDDKNVWTCLSTFLDRTEQNSKNTRDAYERAVRSFFKSMRNKDLEDLVEEDLKFTKNQIETYQVALRNKYKSATVNSKITALKRAYQKLEDYGFEVRSSWFELDRYNEHDKDSYDALTHDEILKIIDFVSFKRKGQVKALLVRTAYATAFRLDSLLSLTWNDITKRDDTIYIKTLGKGQKWDYKKISDDLYECLMQMRGQNNYDGDDRVFNIDRSTVNKMMDMIRKEFDFQDRVIVFHSFKKSSIEEVANITNYDLKAMQQQGNHSSIVTTLNDYMKKKTLDDMVIVDTSNEVDDDIFDELSHEELLELVKGMDRNTKMKLINKLNK